ncbi:MAG: hypothetical protein HOV94_29070 [Saccharothrix sp.]|nr:hypothetical protein [Saccharothrix sp.]
MKTDVGIRVLTSARIDATSTIEHEVVGQEVFFSFSDGAVSLFFADARAFGKFMAEAAKVSSALGLDSGAVRQESQKFR